MKLKPLISIAIFLVIIISIFITYRYGNYSDSGEPEENDPDNKEMFDNYGLEYDYDKETNTWIFSIETEPKELTHFSYLEMELFVLHNNSGKKSSIFSNNEIDFNFINFSEGVNIYFNYAPTFKNDTYKEPLHNLTAHIIVYDSNDNLIFDKQDTINITIMEGENIYYLPFYAFYLFSHGYRDGVIRFPLEGNDIGIMTIR